MLIDGVIPRWNINALRFLLPPYIPLFLPTFFPPSLLLMPFRPPSLHLCHVSSTHSPNNSVMHWLTDSLLHSFTHRLIHSFTHSINQPLNHPFIHSITHSVTMGMPQTFGFFVSPYTSMYVFRPVRHKTFVMCLQPHSEMYRAIRKLSLLGDVLFSWSPA